MKSKIQNFWYYYRNYVLAGMLICIVIGNQIYEQRQKVRMDHQIAFVTTEYISEDIRTQVSEILEEIWKDTDHDGEVHVGVYLYRYDMDTKNARDPNEFMAAGVQLAADLKEKESVWYITDQPDILMDVDMGLVYGTNWENVEAFGSIEPGLMEGYAVLVRKPEGEELLRKLVSMDTRR